MMPLTADETRVLVRAAVAAPSADNCHVVKFEQSGALLRLRVERSAMIGAPPHRKAFHEFAFGAIIENIVVTACALGRQATVRRYPLWRGDRVIAEIEFTDASAERSTDACHDAIFARTTNRRLYERGRMVPKETLDALARSAASLGGVRVDWLDEPARRSRALRMIFAAERERFANERFHSELFEAIRFDVGWHATTESGLPPGALEVEAPFRRIFRALRRWKLQRLVNTLGAARLLALRAAWLPAWTAPHIALFSVPMSGDADLVDAGRALQRVWLSAAQRSIAFQPLAASVAIAWQAPGNGWVNDHIAERLRRDLDDLAGARRAVMLARLGYATAPSIRAGRCPAGSYLLDGVR